jgi:hypothetical protein
MNERLEEWQNSTDRGQTEVQGRKKTSGAVSSNRNPTKNGLFSGLGLRVERPATTEPLHSPNGLQTR